MNNADLRSPALCEAACFAATYQFSTVPYFSLDQPRSVTLVYNGDQAFPRPFIFADVNGDDGTGVAVNEFTMSATVNGAPVTFLTGSTLLSFSGNLGLIRLSGQFDGSNLATNIYPLVITVRAYYADGTNVQQLITTQLMVLNEASAPVAKGWTIAGVQRLYSTISPGYLITGGDGSGVRFTALGVKAADYTRLTYDAGSATYTRTYPDGSRAIFNSGGQQTSFIEPNGRAYTFSYDGYGRVEQIRDPYKKKPNSSEATFIGLTYDANGLRTIQEPDSMGNPWSGRTTSIFVDSNRCLVSGQDPDGYATGFGCDAYGRLAIIYDRRGGVTTIGYNEASWKLSQITLPQIPVDAGGGSTTPTNPVIHYGPWQTVTPAYVQSAAGYVEDAGGRRTYFLVNRFGQAVDITDPLGQHTVVKRFGILPTRVIHPNGWTDTVMYDTAGRVTRNHPAGGSATDYQYNPANSLTLTNMVISGAGSRLDTLFFNGSQQVYRGTYSGTPRQTMDFVYDPATLRLASATDGLGHSTSYTYNPGWGNLATTTLPGGRVTSKTFDRYGRDSVVVAPGLAAQTSLYDIVNRTTSTSAAGTTLTMVYDQLFQTDLYDGNNNHYHTDYNALGWPTNQCDAFSACSTTRYDASGLTMSTTNRRGQIVSVTRDGQGRITSKSGTGLVPSYFSYSTNNRDMVAWNAVERDSIFTNPGSILGAPATDSVVTWIDGKRYRIYHRYPKAVADLDSVRIISNTGTTFSDRVATYSSSGFLTSFKIGGTTIPFTPDADGTGGTFGYPGFNRTSAALSTHWTNSATFSNGLASTFQRSYHYDQAGRLDQVMIGNGLNSQHTFSYDGLGRLTGRDVRTNCSFAGNDPASGQSYSCATVLSSDVYTYDAMGNRTDHGGAPTTGNRYVTLNGAYHYYDADGNVIQKYKDQVYNRQWFWNAESQLDSAMRDSWYRTGFDYNAFGKPVRVWDGDPNGRHVARYLLWDGDALVAELTAAGQREVDYIYLPGSIDRPFAHTLGATSPTEVRYHEVDELGNVIGTSASGSLSQSNTYDAWGSVTYAGNANQHLTWKGLWWNGDLTGIIYMRNRWYDPESGRFMNEDPAGFAGGPNLYAFGGNDPINSRDPSGLCDMGAALEYALEALATSEEVAWSHHCTDLEPVVVTANPGTPQGGDGGGVPGSGGFNGGGGGAETGPTPAATNKPTTNWPACLTQAALLTGTLYLDMETFGQASEVRALSNIAQNAFREAGNRRRMKAVRRALGKFFKKNLAAADVVDDAVSGWRQETWAMGPAIGINSWADAASLLPFAASANALYGTVEACRKK